MKLMVIDGNSIVNRSFYGVRPLTTRDGLYTNAVYGFVTTLQRLLEEEAPEALCVTFDRREPTFRHLEYEGYKAQRKGMPEELAQQMPVLKEVLDAMDVPRYELAGYEADDLIGTISRKCEDAGWECVAVTGDKDSLQLVTDRTRVKLVSTRMGQTTTKDMTPATFREAYGFDPIHIIDLKALMGDASDNIPGVKGVGEKTAMALVQRYQTIERYDRSTGLVGAQIQESDMLNDLLGNGGENAFWYRLTVTNVANNSSTYYTLVKLAANQSASLTALNRYGDKSSTITGDQFDNINKGLTLEEFLADFSIPAGATAAWTFVTNGNRTIQVSGKNNTSAPAAPSYNVTADQRENMTEIKYVIVTVTSEDGTAEQTYRGGAVPTAAMTVTGLTSPTSGTVYAGQTLTLAAPSAGTITITVNGKVAETKTLTASP